MSRVGETDPYRVIGHRGACGHAPENTLSSIAKAAELGALSVEFDVKLTADAVPILMHDSDLDRTTDGRGPVRDHTFDEITKLDAGSSFSPHFFKERVPRLDDALDLVEALGLAAVAEIKPCRGREAETGAAVARAFLGRSVTHLLSSFSGDALRAAAAVAPGSRRALLVEAVPGDWRVRVAATGAVELHAAARRLDTAVRGVTIPVRAYTVDEAGLARRLSRLGVAGIFTSHPALLAPVFG